MNVSRLFGVTLVCSLGLEACVIVDRYTGSRPVGPYESERWRPGEVASVDSDGVHLDIQVQNVKRVWTQAGPLVPIFPIPKMGSLKPPLTIWINITCKDGIYWFDPMRVSLLVDEEDKLYPSGYSGPGVGGRDLSWSEKHRHSCGILKKPLKDYQASHPATERFVGFRECFNCNNLARPHKSVGGPVPLEAESCFVLFFDTDPSPEHKFILSLEGLLRHGEKLAVHEIQFEKGFDKSVEVAVD